MKVKLIDGTEKEINLKLISGTKRNEIIDAGSEFQKEGNKMIATFKPGKLMTAVVKEVIPKDLDIDTLTIESFDEIYDLYSHLFNQDSKEAKKKDLDGDEKSTDALSSENQMTE